MIRVSPVNDPSPTENLQRAYYMHVEFAAGLWPSVLYHPSCFPVVQDLIRTEYSGNKLRI